MDRELAIDADYVSIQNDIAEYKTSWDAAGSAIDWKMVHYDVQLHGGIVLHEGKIAEMQTGEGKTLVSTLPAYLNAIPGLGVHIITVNNYLARRDCEWNRPLFAFLGLTVDCIDLYRPHSPERIKAYKADIVPMAQTMSLVLITCEITWSIAPRNHANQVALCHD